MISEKEVKNIAKLARINLTEKEVEKYRKDLSSILNYFEKLKKVDLSDIKKTDYTTVNSNISRKDEVKKIILEQRTKMIELFPEKKEDYLKVKSIL